MEACFWSLPSLAVLADAHATLGQVSWLQGLKLGFLAPNAHSVELEKKYSTSAMSPPSSPGRKQPASPNTLI